MKQILDSLETRFQVKFTYADEYIDPLVIKGLPHRKQIEEYLDFLENQTNLKFKILNSRYITITKESADMKICGTIVDGENFEPLPGAVVRFKDKYFVSGHSGTFQLTSSEISDSISIQFFGYYEKKVALTDLSDDCPQIALAPVVTLLQEVTVRNYLVKGIDKKIDGSISITLPETEILPGLTEPDVLHTIQKLPGIQSIDETVSDINVRGGTNDQNLVLWDGVKMYQTGHFFGLISAFSPYLTEKVSLIKNGSRAKYHEGVSSTIDIRTYDKVNQKIEGGAGINMINGDAFLKIPLGKKLAFHVSSRRSVADIVNSPAFSNYFDRAFRDTEVAQFVSGTDTLSTNENFFFYDYSGKLLYDITEKDKLRLSFLKVFNRVEYEESGLVGTTLDTKTSELQQANIAGSVIYQRQWSKKVTSDLAFNVSSYNLESINFDIPNNQRLKQENEVLDLSFLSEFSFRLSERFKLNTGYQLNEIGVSNLDDINNPSFRRFIKEVLRTHGQFTELNYTSSTGNTIIQTGIRVNYFDKFDKWRIEPRLAVNQLLSKNLTLELLAETKSQVTTQIIDFQTDFLGVEKRRWVMVNDDDIPVITSRQVSLGAHYQKNNLLLSLEGYIKRVNAIVTSSQGFQNQFEFVRTDGSYDSRGIDVLVNNRIGRFNLWTSYSIAKNDYEFEVLMPPIFPNNLDITHSSTLGVSYQHQGLEISVGVNYRTGKPLTRPDDLIPIFDDKINYELPNSSRVENYLRPDFSARYKFDLGNRIKAQVGASLWNFINQENIINRYYTINQDQAIQQVDEQALGLTPNVMLRLEF